MIYVNDGWTYEAVNTWYDYNQEEYQTPTFICSPREGYEYETIPQNASTCLTFNITY